ncbi:MAG TPA: alpha/beta hydrolase [Burkholderiales bacterium]|nr:alpha/beta hydrolase [Burkholderiales bacterium]
MLDGMFGQLSACLSHDTTKIIQEINCLTKIISVANDILVAPKHATLFNLLIPKSSLHFIPNYGHMIQLEKPNELLDMLI